MSRAAATSFAGDLESRITLDALFRRNAAANPRAPALADPPDRASFTDGAPRTLDYGETDAAVERLARRLRSFGLPDRTAVAIQLPNTVEAVVTLLATLRAGMIALPVPVLWRRSDLVAAFGRMDVKAMVTVARLGGECPAEAACQAAADLFALSFPCAFGSDVLDGVVPLELDTKALGKIPDPFPPPAVTSDTESVAVATFDAAPNGFYAVGRSHAELLAAGLGTLFEAKIGPGERIVSMLPISSLAGIAGALVPWLLSGGALELVHGHAPQALVDPRRLGRAHLVAPAAAMPEIARRGGGPFASLIAVHRAAGTRTLDPSALPGVAAVDLTLFGETGAIALRRNDAAHAMPIPLGPVTAPAGHQAGPAVIETRLDDDGMLALRGAMVPRRPFPSDTRANAPRLEADQDGWVETGFRCRAAGKTSFEIEAGPAGIAAVGGLRFGLDDLATRVAKAAGGAKVEVVDDRLLGERLRIASDDPERDSGLLAEAGHSKLVTGAVTGNAARSAAG